MFLILSNWILENNHQMEIRRLHLSAKKKECMTSCDPCELRDRAWFEVYAQWHCISLPVLYPFVKQCLIEETIWIFLFCSLAIIAVAGSLFRP